MKPLQYVSRSVRSKPVRSNRIKGVKNKTLAPRLKAYAPSFHRILFGEDKCFPNQAALNRHNLKQRFLGELVQQNQFESILDANPANRFSNHSDPDFTTRRYAKNPEIMVTTRHGPDEKDSDRIIVSASAKSYLTEQGHLQAVGALPTAVWMDDHPHQLANLAYAHVYETNKVKESMSVNNGVTHEEIVQLKLDLISQLEARLHTGSPMTSTTAFSLIDDYLKTWGPADQYIEIDVHKTNIISPSYLAALILFAAHHDKIDVQAKNDWRTQYPKEVAPDSKKMEKLLIQHGIDPDGPWTKRDRCAYFALVAAEHMLVGATPANAARIVNLQKI